MDGECLWDYMVAVGSNPQPGNQGLRLTSLVAILKQIATNAEGSTCVPGSNPGGSTNGAIAQSGRAIFLFKPLSSHSSLVDSRI